MCLMFNSNAVTRQVLQFGTWHIVGCLAFTQSWREDSNLEDNGQANYLLWIGFPSLPIAMRPFIDLFALHYSKVLILDGHRNSFHADLMVCVEVYLKWKILQFMIVCTINGV